MSAEMCFMIDSSGPWKKERNIVEVLEIPQITEFVEYKNWLTEFEHRY
jgi:hypothetical protein